jgi:hypothetical protein
MPQMLRPVYSSRGEKVRRLRHSTSSTLARRLLLVLSLLALAAAAVGATQEKVLAPDVDAPAESMEREKVDTEKQAHHAGQKESPAAKAETPATDNPNPNDGGVLDGMETADVPFSSKKKGVADSRVADGKPDDDDGDDDPEKNTKGAAIHYCRHIAACGRRPFLLRGPQSTDSSHDGVTCYCRGPKTANKQRMCYRGACVDQGKSKTFRSDEEVDTKGNCMFTMEDLVEISMCLRKDYENIDPSLRFFTDPNKIFYPEPDPNKPPPPPPDADDAGEPEEDPETPPEMPPVRRL